MEIASKSADKTLLIGKKLARFFKEGDIICLFGNLGSGKTVLTKGIATGLGIPRDEVISPTFVLVRQYPGKIQLNHFDLYRLVDHREIAVLGYEDYFYGKAVTVIEWPDRLGCLLPKDYLRVDMEFKSKDERLIKFSAKGAHYKELMEKISENISA